MSPILSWVFILARLAFDLIDIKNPYQQFKNNALDNVLAFGLADGVRQEALHSGNFKRFIPFLPKIFVKILDTN